MHVHRHSSSLLLLTLLSLVLGCDKEGAAQTRSAATATTPATQSAADLKRLGDEALAVLMSFARAMRDGDPDAARELSVADPEQKELCASEAAVVQAQRKYAAAALKQFGPAGAEQERLIKQMDRHLQRWTLPRSPNVVDDSDNTTTKPFYGIFINGDNARVNLANFAGGVALKREAGKWRVSPTNDMEVPNGWFRAYSAAQHAAARNLSEVANEISAGKRITITDAQTTLEDRMRSDPAMIAFEKLPSPSTRPSTVASPSSMPSPASRPYRSASTFPAGRISAASRPVVRRASGLPDLAAEALAQVVPLNLRHWKIAPQWDVQDSTWIRKRDEFMNAGVMTFYDADFDAGTCTTRIGGTYIQGRKLTCRIRVRDLSEADRLNGLEWSGDISFGARLRRTFEKGKGWSEWQGSDFERTTVDMLALPEEKRNLEDRA